MADAVGVQVLDALDDLVDDLGCHELRQRPVSLDPLEHLSALALLHDNVNVV